jgi:hypothetical protein
LERPFLLLNAVYHWIYLNKAYHHSLISLRIAFCMVSRLTSNVINNLFQQNYTIAGIIKPACPNSDRLVKQNRFMLVNNPQNKPYLLYSIIGAGLASTGMDIGC